MAKKLVAVVKLAIQAGKATPAPPIGNRKKKQKTNRKKREK